MKLPKQVPKQVLKLSLLPHLRQFLYRKHFPVRNRVGRTLQNRKIINIAKITYMQMKMENMAQNGYNKFFLIII